MPLHLHLRLPWEAPAQKATPSRWSRWSTTLASVQNWSLPHWHVMALLLLALIVITQRNRFRQLGKAIFTRRRSAPGRPVASRSMPGPPPPKRTAPAKKPVPQKKPLTSIHLKPLGSVHGTVFEEAATAPANEELLASVLGSATQPSKDTMERKVSAPDQICLLDGRRAQNLAIAMRGAKVGVAELVMAMRGMDSNVLAEEVVEALALAYPSPEEVKLLQQYPGLPSALRDIDRDALALAAVPRGASRLRLLAIASGFEVANSRVHEALRTARIACLELRTSSRLHKVFRMAHHAASKADHRFVGPGFALGGLLQLKDARGTSGLSIIHYVCIECRLSEANFVDSLLAELRHVPLAAAAAVGSVPERLQELYRLERGALHELRSGRDEYYREAGPSRCTAFARLVALITRTKVAARCLQREATRTAKVLRYCELFLGYERNGVSTGGLAESLDTAAIGIVASFLECFKKSWKETSAQQSETSFSRRSSDGGLFGKTQTEPTARPRSSSRRRVVPSDAGPGGWQGGNSFSRTVSESASRHANRVPELRLPERAVRPRQASRPRASATGSHAHAAPEAMQESKVQAVPRINVVPAATPPISPGRVDAPVMRKKVSDRQPELSRQVSPGSPMSPSSPMEGTWSCVGGVWIQETPGGASEGDAAAGEPVSPWARHQNLVSIIAKHKRF
mmetsp:Transcript_24321/g.54145  ORF Transcript_24321/g.54145 Transcript_24321/m.54145 type:complete len:684 (+) Transcript_24321:76-2127(+)